MAKRPWVKPEEVKAYSEYKCVQERKDERLAVDIARAESYVIAYTNNTFEDVEAIPDPVRTAVILLAESYAYNASADGSTGAKRMKSESFDDYSYTAADAVASDADGLGLKALLDPYVVTKARCGITMRMRRL